MDPKDSIEILFTSSLDTAELTAKIDQILKKLDSIKGKKTDVKISVDTKPLDDLVSKLKGIEDSIQSIGRADFFKAFTTNVSKFASAIANIQDTLKTTLSVSDIKKQFDDLIKSAKNFKTIIETTEFNFNLDSLDVLNNSFKKVISDVASDIANLQNSFNNLKKLFNEPIYQSGRTLITTLDHESESDKVRTGRTKKTSDNVLITSEQQNFVSAIKDFINQINSIDFTPFVDNITSIRTLFEDLNKLKTIKLPISEENIAALNDNISQLNDKINEFKKQISQLKKYNESNLFSNLTDGIKNFKNSLNNLLASKTTGANKGKNIFTILTDELTDKLNISLKTIDKTITRISENLKNIFVDVSFKNIIKQLNDVIKKLNEFSDIIKNIKSTKIAFIDTFIKQLDSLSETIENNKIIALLSKIDSIINKISSYNFDNLINAFKTLSVGLGGLFNLDEKVSGSKSTKTAKSQGALDTLITALKDVAKNINDLKTSLGNFKSSKQKEEINKTSKIDNDNLMLDCCKQIAQNTSSIHSVLASFIGGTKVSDIIGAIKELGNNLENIKISYVKASGIGPFPNDILKRLVLTQLKSDYTLDFSLGIKHVINQIIDNLKAYSPNFKALKKLFGSEAKLEEAIKNLYKDVDIFELYEGLSVKKANIESKVKGSEIGTDFKQLSKVNFDIFLDFTKGYLGKDKNVLENIKNRIAQSYQSDDVIEKFNKAFVNFYNYLESNKRKRNVVYEALGNVLRSFMSQENVLEDIVKSKILTDYPKLNVFLKGQDYSFIKNIIGAYVKNKAKEDYEEPNKVIDNVIKFTKNLSGITNISFHTILNDSFEALKKERVLDTSKFGLFYSLATSSIKNKIKLDLSSVKFKYDDLIKLHDQLVRAVNFEDFLKNVGLDSLESFYRKLGIYDLVNVVSHIDSLKFRNKNELKQTVFLNSKSQILKALSDYTNLLNRLNNNLIDFSNPKDVDDFLKFNLYYKRLNIERLEKEYSNVSKLFKSKIDQIKKSLYSPNVDSINENVILTVLGLKTPDEDDILDYSKINVKDVINKYAKKIKIINEEFLKEIKPRVSDFINYLDEPELADIIVKTINAVDLTKEFRGTELHSFLLNSLKTYVLKFNNKSNSVFEKVKNIITYKLMTATDMFDNKLDQILEKNPVFHELLNLINLFEISDKNFNYSLGYFRKFNITNEVFKKFNDILGETYWYSFSRDIESNLKTLKLDDLKLFIDVLKTTPLNELDFIKNINYGKLKDEEYRNKIIKLLNDVVYVYGDKIKQLYNELGELKFKGAFKNLDQVHTIDDMVDYIRYNLIFKNKTTPDIARDLLSLNRFNLSDIEEAFNKSNIFEEHVDFLGRPLSVVSKMMNRLVSVFSCVSYYYLSLYIMDYLRDIVNESFFSQVRIFDYEKEIQKYISPEEPYQALKPLTAKMGIRYGLSRDDIWNAFIEFAKQGKSIAETIQLTEGAMLGLNVAAVDYKGIVTYLTTATNIWKNEFSSVIPLIDKLAYVQASTAASSEVLIEAMKRSGSVAKTFGVDVDTLQGYIAAISERTLLSGEVIGTSLKTIIERSQRMRTLRLLMSLEPFKGIEFIDISRGKVLDTPNILSIVASKWSELTDVQKKLVGEQIAGNRQLNAFIALMESMPRVTEIVEGSLENTGYAMRANQVELEKLTKSWTKLKVSLGMLFEGVGQSLAFMLSKLMSIVSSVFSNKILGSSITYVVSLTTAFAGTYIVVEKLTQALLYVYTLLKSQINLMNAIGGFSFSNIFNSWSVLLGLVTSVIATITSFYYTYNSLNTKMTETQLVLNNKLKETIKILNQASSDVKKYGSASIGVFEEINSKLGKLYTLDELKQLEVPVKFKEGRIVPDLNPNNFENYLKQLQDKLILSGENIPRVYQPQKAISTLESAFSLGFQKVGQNIDKYRDIVKSIYLLREALMPYQLIERKNALQQQIKSLEETLNNLYQQQELLGASSNNMISEALLEDIKKYNQLLAESKNKLESINKTNKIDIDDILNIEGAKVKASNDVIELAKYIYNKLGAEAKKLIYLKPLDFKFIDTEDLDKITATFEGLFSLVRYQKMTKISDVLKREFDDLVNNLKYVDEYIQTQYEMASERTSTKKLGTDEFVGKLIIINNEINRLKNEIANYKLEAQVGSTVSAEMDTYREKIDKAEKSLEAFTYRYKDLTGQFTIFERFNYIIDMLISKLSDYKTVEAWAKFLETINNINPELRKFYDESIGFSKFSSALENILELLTRFKTSLDNINNSRYKVYLDFILNTTGLNYLINAYNDNLIDKVFKNFYENLDLAKNVYKKITPDLREHVASYIKSHLTTNLEDIKKALGPLDLRRNDIVKYLEMLGKSEKELEYFDTKKGAKETSAAIKEAIRKAEADFQHLQTLRQHWQQMLPNKYILKYDAETQKLKEELKVKNDLLKKYESQLGESDRLKLQEDIAVLKHKIELQEKYRDLAVEIANFEEYQILNKINLENFKTNIDLARELAELKYQALTEPTLDDDIKNLKLKTDLRLQELEYEKQIKYEEKYRIALNAGFNELEAQRLALRSEELELLDTQIQKERNMLDVAIKRAMLERYKKAQTETQQIKDTFTSTLISVLSNKDALEKQKQILDLMIKLQNLRLEGEQASYGVALAESLGDINKINEAREKWNSVARNVDETRRNMEELNKTTSKWSELLTNIGDNILKKIVDKLSDFIFKYTGLEDVLTNFFGRLSEFRIGKRKESPILTTLGLTQVGLTRGLNVGTALTGFSGLIAAPSMTVPMISGGFSSSFINTNVQQLVQPSMPQPFSLFGRNNSVFAKYFGPALLGYAIGSAVSSPAVGALGGGLTGWLIGGVTGGIIGAIAGFLGARKKSQPTPEPPPPMREFYPLFKNTEALDRNTSALLKLNDNIFNPPQVFEMPKATIERYNAPTINITINTNSNQPNNIANTVVRAIETAYSNISKRLVK